MQRNFEPMRKQVEAWQRSELTHRFANYHDIALQIEVVRDL